MKLQKAFCDVISGLWQSFLYSLWYTSPLHKKIVHNTFIMDANLILTTFILKKGSKMFSIIIINAFIEGRDFLISFCVYSYVFASICLYSLTYFYGTLLITLMNIFFAGIFMASTSITINMYLVWKYGIHMHMKML